MRALTLLTLTLILSSFSTSQTIIPVSAPNTLAAVNAAVATVSTDGDIVQLAAGLFSDCSTLITSAPTNVAFTLQGAGAGLTILDCDPTPGAILDLSAAERTKDLTIQNLSIRNTGGGLSVIDADMGSGTTLTIRNVTVADAADSPLLVAGPGALLLDNVHMARTAGILVRSPDAAMTTTTVMGCLFQNTTDEPSRVASITLPSADTLIITDTVIEGFSLAADRLLTGSSTSTRLTIRDGSVSSTGATLDNVRGLINSEISNVVALSAGVLVLFDTAAGPDLEVTGTTVSNVRMSASGKVLASGNSAANLVVSDSVIRDCVGSTMVEGAFTASLIITDTAFERNTASLLTDAAFQFGGPCLFSGVVAVNNTCSSVKGVLHSGSSPTDGVTIQNVVLTGNTASGGSALDIEGASLTVVGTNVISNNEGLNGGGMHVKIAGAATGSGSIILRHNSASSNGGGLYVTSLPSMASTVSVLVDSNTAGGAGGGVACNCDAATSIELGGSFVVTGNTAATGAGGGLAVMGTLGLTTLGGSHTITHNTAAAAVGGGVSIDGLLALAPGNPTLHIESNAAAAGGGGIAVISTGGSALTLTSTNLNVTGCSTTLNGGGAHVASASFNVTFEGSTFVGNSAGGSGGAVYAAAAPFVNFVGVSVLGNMASAAGSAVWSGTGAHAVLDGATIEGNTGVGSAVHVANSGALSVTNSLIARNAASGASPGGLTLDTGVTAAFDGPSGVCGNAGASCNPNVGLAGTAALFGVADTCAHGTPASCAVGATGSPCVSCRPGWGPPASCDIILNCVAGPLCFGAAGCTECAPGFALADDGLTCVRPCLAGRFYVDSTSVCGTCDASCATCSGSATSCTSCPPQFELSGTTCVPGSPVLVVRGGLFDVTVANGDLIPTFVDGTKVPETTPGIATSTVFKLTSGTDVTAVITSVSLDASGGDPDGTLSVSSSPSPGTQLTAAAASLGISFSGGDGSANVDAYVDVTVTYTNLAATTTKTATFRVSGRAVACGSPATRDSCGVCSGMGTGHVAESDKDACGVCFGGGYSLDDCGVCSGGNADKDACGVCFGNNRTCAGCDGVPNSGAVADVCGVCGGDGSSCLGCDGIPVPLGGSVYDACGVCGGSSMGVCLQTCDNVTDSGVFFDCAGVCNGTASLDSCGVCSGGTTGIAPGIHDEVCGTCFGQCGGCLGGPSNVTDACGICGGDNSTCAGCDGLGASFDFCGQCGGDNSSCTVTCDLVPGSGVFYDCERVCGGTAAVDTCGICSGGTTGVSPGMFEDSCSVCFGGNRDVDVCGDCFGNNGRLDECRICNGNNTRRDDCGVCFGTNRDKDVCGSCYGNGTQCIGCDFVVGSPLILDACGVCDGTNACLASSSGTLAAYMIWLIVASVGMCLLCIGVIVVVIHLKRREQKEQYQTDKRELAAMDAPDGMITLMLTDVESSTRLWEKYPDDMVEAMDLHNAVFRELIALTHGYEVRTEGDAFIIAFSSALDASRCAIQLQGALLEAPWPPSIVNDRDLPSVPVPRSGEDMLSSSNGTIKLPSSQTSKASLKPPPAQAEARRKSFGRSTSNPDTVGSKRGSRRNRRVSPLHSLEDLQSQTGRVTVNGRRRRSNKTLSRSEMDSDDEQQETGQSSSKLSGSSSDEAIAVSNLDNLMMFSRSKWLFRGLRVRVGLHTCKPERVFDERTQRFNYIGPEMNAAQAVGDAGHGGQTILSHTTKAALRGSLPPGANLSYIGKYAFEGLAGEFPLYQLDAKLLEGREFPPIRAKFMGAMETEPSRDITTMLIAASREVSPANSRRGSMSESEVVESMKKSPSVQILDDMHNVSDSHARMRRRRRRATRVDKAEDSDKAEERSPKDIMFGGDGQESVPPSAAGSRASSRRSSRPRNGTGLPRDISDTQINRMLAPPGARMSRSRSRSGSISSVNSSQSKSRSRSRSRSGSKSRLGIATRVDRADDIRTALQSGRRSSITGIERRSSLASNHALSRTDTLGNLSPAGRSDPRLG